MDGHARILLRPAEAAEMIAISRSRVYEMLRDGTLKATRIGRSVRIRRDHLEEWVAQQADDPEDNDLIGSARAPRGLRGGVQ